MYVYAYTFNTLYKCQRYLSLKVDLCGSRIEFMKYSETLLTVSATGCDNIKLSPDIDQFLSMPFPKH